MARIRSIKPELCTSFTMAVLSDAAERTFVRLWTHADDEGRGIDSAKLIKAAIYPLNDEKTEERVEELLCELEAAGFFLRYEVEGKRYFQVPKFDEHQKPRHPSASKFPAPLPDMTIASTIRRNPTADGRKPPAVVVGVVVDGDVAMSPPQKRRGAPETFPVTDDLKDWAAAERIYVDLGRETERFLDHHRAKGSKFEDWRAAWRLWMSKAQELSNARPSSLRLVASECAACEGMGVVMLDNGLAQDCECKTRKAS